MDFRCADKRKSSTFYSAIWWYAYNIQKYHITLHSLLSFCDFIWDFDSEMIILESTQLLAPLSYNKNTSLYTFTTKWFQVNCNIFFKISHLSFYEQHIHHTWALPSRSLLNPCLTGTLLWYHRFFLSAPCLNYPRRGCKRLYMWIPRTQPPLRDRHTVMEVYRETKNYAPSIWSPVPMPKG